MKYEIYEGPGGEGMNCSELIQALQKVPSVSLVEIVVEGYPTGVEVKSVTCAPLDHDPESCRAVVLITPRRMLTPFKPEPTP